MWSTLSRSLFLCDLLFEDCRNRTVLRSCVSGKIMKCSLSQVLPLSTRLTKTNWSHAGQITSEMSTALNWLLSWSQKCNNNVIGPKGRKEPSSCRCCLVCLSPRRGKLKETKKLMPDDCYTNFIFLNPKSQDMWEKHQSCFANEELKAQRGLFVLGVMLSTSIYWVFAIFQDL